MAPLVSFIVTCYNLPRGLLGQCVARILQLGLTPEEREVIVVDDGSHQSPMSELRPWTHHIIYVRQKNAGPGAARNLGIRMCRGRYIQFVDGDDLLIPPVYDQCLRFVRQHTPDMLLFGYTRTTDEPHAAFAPVGPMTGEAYLRRHNLHALVWSVLFRAERLGSLRFLPGIVHEDEDFLPLLLLQVDTLFVADAQAYYYRPRPESITRNFGDAWTRRRLADMECVLGHLKRTAVQRKLPPAHGLQRRLEQLTADHLFNTIRLTRSASETERCVVRLRGMGLLPLPFRRHTQKHVVLCALFNFHVGRLLCILLAKVFPRPTASARKTIPK